MGKLYYDPGKEGLLDKLKARITEYRERTHREPKYCAVNIHQLENEISVLGVMIKPVRWILKNYIWITDAKDE